MAEGPKRILLVRLDGIGDALLCVPALEGLRRAFPDAEFGAVCTKANSALLSRARVSRVHVAGEGDEEALAREVSAVRYTDALVATEEPLGYILARRSGARRRAGFWHRFEKPFKSMWQFTHLTDAVFRSAAWVDEPEHEVYALYRLAERLGAVAPPPDDPARLRSWLDVEAGASHVVHGALAVQIARKWFANGWDARAVAEMTAAALETSSLSRCELLAAESDAGLALAVMEALPAAARGSGAIRLAPQAALRRWLGTIAEAAALLTPDTGAAHAAGMLGVPVVDVFEPMRFAQLSRQWRPWAAPSRCLARPANERGAAAAFGRSAGAAVRDLISRAGAVC